MKSSGNNRDLNSHALNPALIRSSPSEKNPNIELDLEPPDPEEAVLPPVRSPGVLNNPEVFAGGFVGAIANQEHGVVGQLWWTIEQRLIQATTSRGWKGPESSAT